MAERDAFGNEIDDAPPEAAPPAAAPVDAGRHGALLSIVVVALVAAGVAGIVIVAFGGKDESSSSSKPAGDVLAPRRSPEQSATAGSAPPPEPASLLRPRALAGALDRLRSHGRLRLLRVAADRVDAQLVTRSGALRNMQITATGDLRDFGTGGSGAGGLPTIPYATIDVRAPGRIVRVAAARSGRNPSRLDYLVLLKLPTAGQSWNVYFKPDGLHFAADRHGASVIRR